MKLTPATFKPALRPLRGDFPVYLVAWVGTSILTWLAYNLRGLTWRVPISYADGGDPMFYMGNIKTVLETGWYERQPLLGAPYGQVLHDFKTADNLPPAVFKVLDLFTDDFGTAMNVYFFLGFPLAAVTAVWFLRTVGVSRALSAALATLFALAPYHFIRGQGHMWLGEYWAIPLGLGLVVLIASGRRIWGRRTGHGRFVGWLTGPTVGTLVALALVTMSNSYYGLWTLELIAVAGLIRFIATRDVRAFLGAVAAGVWVAVVAVANMLPDMLYARSHGANATAVQRLPQETEVYGIKLAQLILPSSYHRVGPLRSLRQYYDAVFPLPSESPVLGVVAAIGLVIALCVAVYALLAPRARAAQYSMFRALAGLTLVALLIGMVGGVSTFLGFITSDLRGSNRISIFLAMLSLGVLGLSIDAALRRSTRKLPRPVAMGSAVVVASVVLCVGYYDQVPPDAPNHSASRALFEEDESFVREIEAATVPGGMILQLPNIPFPEFPQVNGVSYSDQLMPYLHSDTLKWSGGAVKGRPTTDWISLATKSLGFTETVEAATLAGFDGVLLDTQAFTDRSEVPTEDLTELLGRPVVSDDRYRYFSTADLRRALDVIPSGEREDIARRVLRPTLARWEPNFADGFNYPDSLKDYDPRFEIENASDTTATVDLTFDIAYSTGDRVLRFDLPGGGTREVSVGPAAERQSLRIEAPPGRSTIRATVVEGAQPANTSARDSGPIVVSAVKTTDVDLAAALAGLRPARSTD